MVLPVHLDLGNGGLCSSEALVTLPDLKRQLLYAPKFFLLRFDDARKDAHRICDDVEAVRFPRHRYIRLLTVPYQFQGVQHTRRESLMVLLDCFLSLLVEASA